MKIFLGDNVERPVLSARFTNHSIEKLMNRPGFAELSAEIGELNDNKDIKIEKTSRYFTYSLMANRIRRRPVASHEQRLYPFVRLLEWGCILGGSDQYSTVTLQEIDSRPSLDGYYRIRTRLRWPDQEDKTVSNIATTAMQAFGRQLLYSSYRRASEFDREVYVDVAEKDRDYKLSKLDVRRAEINTAPSPTSPWSGGRNSQDYGTHVIIRGNYIASLKEQLVHLVGAAAIGHADTLVRDQ